MRSKLYNDVAIRRNQRRMTQRQLAKLAGCSPSTIQAIELCRLKPSRQLAERINFALRDIALDLDYQEWL
jgi:DNA-binding XRE family transcriptional regulator